MAIVERRTLAECIAMLPENSAATIGEDFASDVEATIAVHREPMDCAGQPIPQRQPPQKR
jgi:hypothetical protein